MRIKRLTKKIGRSFVPLKQENERIIRQSVLIVDNGYSWIGQLSTAIQKIKNYFPKADITILTFEHRRSNLQNDFPEINYLFPSQRLIPKRYGIALQLLKMRKSKFDSVVLFSLDASVLIATLFFLRYKVILYNQWAQWWHLKLKEVKEIFKLTYVKKNLRFSFKNIFRRIGLFFVLLQHKNEEILKHQILLIDNGYASTEQIECVIRRIKESLPWAKISILASEQRRTIKDNFYDLKFIRPDGYMIGKYRIARHMLRLRKNRYDYVVLLSLDITPIIASLLFKNSKIFLYNQWHQWWVLKPKPIKDYLMLIPHFFYNIIIFVYLLISVSGIFLIRSFNVFRFCLLNKEGGRGQWKLT